MWKNYLYFTQKEKTGIFILFIIIIVVFTARFFIHQKQPDDDILPLENFEREDKEAILSEKTTVPEDQKHSGYEKSAYTLHYFDPNTIDSLSMIKMGLKPWLAKNIIKYRSKGGKFRSPEDFSRVYGLSPEKYEELKSFIRIEGKTAYQKSSGQNEKVFPNTDQIASVSSRQNQSFPKEEKYPEGVLVDIAVADTVEFKKIPRIGSAFAGRIVKYRQILGGFYDVEQIQEVYGMTPELYEEIRPWLKVNPDSVRYIDVNRASVEKLKSHPYLNFYQAKAIVELKKKKGKLQNIQELSLLEEFTERDLQRLKYYFLFE